MTAPARVALVCDYQLGYLGGAQTAMLEQARVLAGAGHPVIIIAPDEPTAPTLPDVPVLRIPSRGTLPGLRLPLIMNTPEVRARLREWLHDHRIGVVHLHSEFGLAAAAIDVAGELGVPVVHTVHTFFWQTRFPAQRALAAAVTAFHRRLTGSPADSAPRLADRAGESALRAMTWRIARRATVVISPSAHQADRLREAGIDRVAVVPNTLATAPEPAEPPLPYRPVKIIWLGRCTPEKRILPFVRAAVAAIGRAGPGRLHVTVAGAGQQLAAARRIAAGTPEITFLGARPHHEMAGLLHDHHLLALTSYGFDNQPMSIAEAVLAGRGVLHCDPRLTEGTDGGAGILTDGPDEAALTARLVELAENPDRVAAACRAARSERMIFEPATFLTKINEAYRSVRSAAGSRRERTR
ncbi:glycosyltransferase family 4 protein [Microlunatus parietis]|uniref:Glycosyltransferase involved in cell wall biosynthesis n=1 Tax=Microlunatus parietis TaxID=682979 RepID=A0A7Y9I5W7_9ACTN|nr:glycosyltransferase family 4 protein [Microlunatus parietis]NYE70871.1 glycosyltransferase involved in cell wall biosynthesis [Microlunatus parietis]